MKFDWSDIGNVVLGVGASAGVYLATKGYIAESILVISIAGVIKAFCSAVDNYNYKKTVVPIPVTP